MKNVSEQYIVDRNGYHLAVIVTLPGYRRLISAWEELKEIQAFDQAKKRTNTFIPIDKTPLSRD
jgi:hypothetical protein